MARFVRARLASMAASTCAVLPSSIARRPPHARSRAGGETGCVAPSAELESTMGAPISEMGGTISEMGGPISEMGARISEMGSRISEMGGPISEMGARISEMGARIWELESTMGGP